MGGIGRKHSKLKISPMCLEGKDTGREGRFKTRGWAGFAKKFRLIDLNITAMEKSLRWF